MEENRNEELHRVKGEAVRDLHKIMLEAMRSREVEILKFLGFVLAALAAFFALGWFKTEQSAIPPEVLLPIGSVIAIVILFFGAWYALALSYNYRYLMIVCYWLQKKLDLLRYQPDWKPKKFRWLGVTKFAPEIFRTQVLLFFTLILIILLGFHWITTKEGIQCCPQSQYLVWGVAVASIILILFLGFCFYPIKYNKRVDQAKANYKKAQKAASKAD